MASEELDLDKVMADIPNILHDGDLDDVVLTDADMNDADLLEQFRAVGGGNDDDEEYTDHSVKEEYQPVVGLKNAGSTNEPSNLPCERPENARRVKPAFALTSFLESKLRTSDPEVRRGYFRLEMQRADQRKRAGDQAGVIEALREAKAL